jgi:hypothetical protein
MNLIGLDLNTTRARAVQGPEGLTPPLLPLDGPHADLPLAVSMEHRRIDVGRAGLALCRRSPHLACTHFLPHLGANRTWAGGRHRLDVDKALGHVFDRIRPACAGAEGLVLALPGYLGRAQVEHLTGIAGKAKLNVLGSTTAPLALALAGHAEQTWTGAAVVAEVDDHALTWAAVTVAYGQIATAAERRLPLLGVKAWKGRLLDAVADRCIRQSRRDPRDSAPAEQMLYDQLDTAMEAGQRGRLVELVVQTEHWCQNLILRPEEVAGFCAPLVRQAVEELRDLLADAGLYGAARAFLVADAAARLPGLLDGCEEAAGVRTPLLVLQPEAAARAAHDLACRFRKREVAAGHLDVAVPLPLRSRTEEEKPAPRVGPILRAGS